MSTGAGSHSVSRRLLIVVDSPDLRDLLVWTFVDNDFEVATAETAAHALAKLSGGSFQAMVMDIDLPDMNGTEFLGRLKANGVSLPTIVVASYAGSAETRELESLGASRVVSKPVKLTAILSAVRELTSSDGSVAHRPVTRTGPAVPVN